MLWFLLKFIAFNLKKNPIFNIFFVLKFIMGLILKVLFEAFFCNFKGINTSHLFFFMFVVKNIYKCNTLDTIVHCLWDLICIYNIECRISYDRLKEVHSWNCYIKGSYLDLQKSLINNFVSQSTNKIALSRETFKYGLS